MRTTIRRMTGVALLWLGGCTQVWAVPALQEVKVNPLLADQLLLPMALMGGGVFTATDMTQHTRTNIDIIRRFLDVDITATQNGRKCWTIEITR